MIDPHSAGMHRPILRPAVFTVAAATALAACGSAPPLPQDPPYPSVQPETQPQSPTGGAPPRPGAVRDGLGEDVDVQATDSAIFGNWDAFVDPEGGPVAYEWSIGTTRGGCEVTKWAHVGGAVRAAVTGLALGDRTVVYFSVRAVDVAGNVSEPSHSDGLTIQLGPQPG